MTIRLGGVLLSGSLQWTDRYAFTPVAQEVKRTLGGVPVVFSQGLTGGRPVTLEATEETGWLTYSMLQSVIAMASVPGAVYTLDFHGETLSVVFAAHENPAIDLKPLQPRAVPQPMDYYIGTIKLMTV